ncbi:DUF5916 domain-containing protein [Pseudogemmatithrix spongiicola]|uniref:DUF5916 domain-containing protein n=1 Tax=Pseudogemmatithrix spongiicola TaxID=3062599 RepID=A0AA49K0F0_9BACT|nr:DUF5916 domain-containing protein [Gemmatimonadaceae bacterium 'strain 138']WKW15200.1 DUF5916 domain-containing protein [Gemmatimonadaceae bacterium 'strain 318']
MRLSLAGVALLLPIMAAAQPSDPNSAQARAVRSDEPMLIDGRDTERVWATAPETDEFYQFTPTEAGPARFRTSIRVAYDDRVLYVFVKAYDPRPDSLVALLSRRDIRTPSEWIKVVIDGFRDRRSALQFMVNPAGVKRDATVYGDVQEDIAWDGVWDAATSIDADGWNAEFAIPFSQLRFTPKDEHVFGFGVWRDVARYGERDAWPVYRPSRQTFASQLGDLVGIRDIGRNRRLEVMPYAVSKNVTEPTPSGWRNPQQQTAGLDLKAGLTNNITLDATINPDFGQVEMDPAVLNLSAFEIRFDERRPFFQEGVNLFRCQGPCEGIFYTRRVGRTPQLRAAPSDPRFSRIQAAAKITGRLEGGAQFGVVAVSSARETGSLGQTIEPQTTTLVGRLVQDFRGGRSQFGTMVTALVRDLDAATEPLLRREAYTLLLQGYHRFADRWEVSGYTGRSTARGSADAIARTQLTSVHYFQRPDHEMDYDPTRRSMDGGVSSLSLRRYAGRVRWETTTRYAAPGTELNDLGFVTLVNDVMLRNQMVLAALRPGLWHRRVMAVASAEQHWTTGGLPTGSQAQLHGFAEFTNFWTSTITYTASNLGATHCVSCARGGPALRQSAQHRVAVTFDGDARRALQPSASVAFARADEGRSWSRAAEVGVVARAGSRTSFELGAGYEGRVLDAQWVQTSAARSAIPRTTPLRASTRTSCS